MFTVATINIQNKYKVKKYDGTYQGEDNIFLLDRLLEKYHVDIAGLQEVNPRYYDQLRKKISSCYHIHGKSRYFQNVLTRHISFLHTFNEAVPVITKHKVLHEKTMILPFLSSYVPRIVTILKIQVKDFGEVFVFNTHLDDRKNKTKVAELRRLFKLIQKVKSPVILMGDFNMTLKNDDFRKFIQDLEKLHIHHVDLKEKTFKEAKSNYAIDHLFLSDCFHVECVFLEKDKKYQNFSDHYPVICQISPKF